MTMVVTSKRGPDPTDLLGRPMTDLRISVTDRCNFRCTFCMPAEQKYHFAAREHILTFEETTRLASIFTRLGVEKIRLTGGEPLLRAEVEKLVRSLKDLPGIRDLALTTNAYLLAEKAASLVDAGLDRVTVSLHSLDPDTFARVNGLGLPLERVLGGIREAVERGLTPVKLNVVVMKDVNEHEIVELARFGREQGCQVRFIEYMDVGTLNAWDPNAVVSAAEILERIDTEFPLEPLERARPGDVARRFRYLDGCGELGVIPSVTQPFCGDCSRVRLSAEGKLFTCLFSAVGHDLKAPLRAGESDAEIEERIRALWSGRDDRYSEERTAALERGTFVPAEKIEMFRIGG